MTSATNPASAAPPVIAPGGVVWILANPSAGRGMGQATAEAMRAAVEDARYQAHLTLSHPAQTPLPCRPEELRAVMVVGGDGTLRAVIERLISLIPASIDMPPILPVPMGTANLVGQYLGQPRTLMEIGVENARAAASGGLRAGLRRMEAASLPSGLEHLGKRLGRAGKAVADGLEGPALERAEQVGREVVETLRHGKLRRLDVGLANGTPFLLMAGIGFDAHVVHTLDQRRRGPIGLWSYAVPALSAVARYGFPPIEVSVDGVRRFGPQPAVVMVANLPPYGTGFPIVPMARGDDGLLDVVCLPCRSKAELAKIVSLAAFGQHLDVPGPHKLQGRVIELRSTQKVPVQVDGDPAAHLPLRCELLPRQIRLLSSAEREASRSGGDASPFFRHNE